MKSRKTGNFLSKFFKGFSMKKKGHNHVLVEIEELEEIKGVDEEKIIL